MRRQGQDCILHRVPDHIPPAEAALFLPMSNGVEWMYRYGDLRLGDTVLVQGPGQQGLSAVLTAKEAGAACIIATGLSRDAHRLALARQLGADHTIDVETESFREKVLDVTGGKGVNVVVNVTGGGRTPVAGGTRSCWRRITVSGQNTANSANNSRRCGRAIA